MLDAKQTLKSFSFEFGFNTLHCQRVATVGRSGMSEHPPVHAFKAFVQGTGSDFADNLI